MARYLVQWNYKSSLGGPFLKGDVIEISEVLAADINRDSPGVLKDTKKKESQDRMKAEAEFARKAEKNRKEEPITKKDFKAVKNGD